MLISNETIKKINLITQSFFNLNRTIDRFLAWSSAEWSFNHFGDTFHKGWAHLMPLLGDMSADILLRYNVPAEYYETHSDTREYIGMLDFFETALQEHIKTYNLITDAITTATINGDYNVEADLKQLMRIWNRFMDQIILLRDKAKLYGENNKAMFDGFSDQFYVLQDIADQLNGNSEDDD